jgi:hypothetical protein
MPGVKVMAVGVLERAMLLDGEDLLARGEHRVNIRWRERLDARPMPTHFRRGGERDDVRRGTHRAEHSAVGSSRRGTAAGRRVVWT